MTITRQAEIEAVEKLQRRCMELEHQLEVERNSKEDQLTDIQQRQIDEVIVKYKERIKSVEDEKMAVRLLIFTLMYLVIFFSNQLQEATLVWGCFSVRDHIFRLLYTGNWNKRNPAISCIASRNVSQFEWKFQTI